MLIIGEINDAGPLLKDIYKSNTPNGIKKLPIKQMTKSFLLNIKCIGLLSNKRVKSKQGILLRDAAKIYV